MRSNTAVAPESEVARFSLASVIAVCGVFPPIYDKTLYQEVIDLAMHFGQQEYPSTLEKLRDLMEKARVCIIGHHPVFARIDAAPVIDLRDQESRIAYAGWLRSCSSSFAKECPVEFPITRG